MLALELVEVLLEREGREAALGMIEEAARRLAPRVEGRFPEAGEAERREQLRTWLEEVFAWEADWEIAPDGRPRIVIHRCPFQDIAVDHPAVCGCFFTTLIGALAGGDEFAHVPIGDGVRCCALEG